MNKPIEMDETCQFLQDIDNNHQLAIYNLIVSKGAMKLWSKGITPNRKFRISSVKKYFGINGIAKTLHEKLSVIFAIVKE